MDQMWRAACRRRRRRRRRRRCCHGGGGRGGGGGGGGEWDKPVNLYPGSDGEIADATSEWEAVPEISDSRPR
jgi:hypothetical protein